MEIAVVAGQCFSLLMFESCVQSVMFFSVYVVIVGTEQCVVSDCAVTRAARSSVSPRVIDVSACLCLC